MKSPKKILIVDDEEDLREILTFNLESEDYKVVSADSADVALGMDDLSSYDLILLDVMMPGTSGFKMAEILKKQSDFVPPPIIFLTAKDTENDLLTGFSLGADDYISKPFSIKELQARVKAVLARMDSISAVQHVTKSHPDHIVLGSLMIDKVSKTVSVNNHDIPLTKKEFEILVLLSSEPERVFSRSDILDRLWPDDCYVMERTVDVHIARLRKKIDNSNVNIINRSGYGYSIVNE